MARPVHAPFELVGGFSIILLANLSLANPRNLESNILIMPLMIAAVILFSLEFFSFTYFPPKWSLGSFTHVKAWLLLILGYMSDPGID